MKDKEIKAEINKFLKIIESDFIKENMYLDRIIYDNLIDIINKKYDKINFKHTRSNINVYNIYR